MALIAFDKFDKYASGATGWTDLASDNGYTTSASGPNIDAGIGRFGDAALNIDSTAYYAIPWSAKTSSTTVIVGMSFIHSSPTVSTAKTLLSASATATGSGLHFEIAWIGGQLFVYNATGGIVGSAMCPINVWHTLEVKCTMANSGSITVRLDGIDVCTAVSGDFLHTTTALGFIQILRGALSPTYVDWVYLCDSTGSTLNDFLGDFRVESVIPDADGGTAAWTPLSGANYTNIDDALQSYDDDTSYISSSTVNQDNLASHVAVTLSGLNSVKFVDLTALTRDDGTNDVALLMVNGANTLVSGTFTTGTAYNWRTFASTTAPDTTAWSVSNINASEFGVRCK